MKRGTRNKVEEVFMELEKAQILACPQIGDCPSCALTGLNRLNDDLRKQGKIFIGAVYCHAQDWELARESNELTIGFVDLPNEGHEVNLELVKDIGLTLASALQAKGFEVNWNGDPHNKVSINVGGKRCAKQKKATKQ